MVIFACLCIAIGVRPEPLYARLPHPVACVPYPVAHVLTQLPLLLLSGLAFFVMRPWLKRTPTITLDTDGVWRSLRPAFWRAAAAGFNAARPATDALLSRVAGRAQAALPSQAGPDGTLARTWRTRAMALWVMLALLGHLLLYCL